MIFYVKGKRYVGPGRLELSPNRQLVPPVITHGDWKYRTENYDIHFYTSDGKRIDCKDSNYRTMNGNLIYINM